MNPKLYVSAGLAFLTFAVYSPTLKFGSLRYDDRDYVFENQHVRTGLSAENVGWAFTTFDCANWHPLTWLSLQLDASLDPGLKPQDFHVTNVLFHVANTVLLFLVFAQMTGMLWRSAMVAALFGLHPLHVESVAWIAERKDVLSAFFWILTMWAYVAYVRRPGVLRYLLVILALALGLMAKPMLVTLPYVLLLLDYWPLGRLDTPPPKELAARAGTPTAWAVSRLFLEKLPLVILSLASCVVTYVAQQEGRAVGTIEKFPLGERIENAIATLAIYIGKTLWPQNLTCFYPYPHGSISLALVLSSGIFLIAVTVGMLFFGRRWPYLPVGWFWYLGTLVPVIGIVQVGDQALADRYTYIPLIGLFLLGTWGISDLLTGLRLSASIQTGLAVVVVAVCSIGTLMQVQHWANDLTLWKHAVQATKDNYLAHDHYGVALSHSNQFQEAREHYQKSLALNPHFYYARQNLAFLNTVEGRRTEAVADYQKVIEQAPSFVPARLNLGLMLREQGRTQESLVHLNKAIEMDPKFIEGYLARGQTLMEQGKFEEAARDFNEAMTLDSTSFRPHVLLGHLALEQGRYPQAQKSYQRALQLMPEQASARPGVTTDLRRSQQLDAIDRKVADMVAGKSKPQGAADTLIYGWLCQQPHHRCYNTAAKFYGEAMSAEPALIKDDRQKTRQRAAASAAQAGTGGGTDAGALTDAEKTRLRQQALGWLKADLSYNLDRAASGSYRDREAAAKTLYEERENPLLACVRDKEALGRLPADERAQWTQYWADLDRAISTVTETASPPH